VTSACAIQARSSPQGDYRGVWARMGRARRFNFLIGPPRKGAALGCPAGVLRKGIAAPESNESADQVIATVRRRAAGFSPRTRLKQSA